MTPSRVGFSGAYCCRGCDAELFHSDTEFEHQTGCWPNFTEPCADEAIEIEDRAAGAETGYGLRCATCGNYIGQLYSDGPGRTTARYCVEWRALRFVKD